MRNAAAALFLAVLTMAACGTSAMPPASGAPDTGPTACAADQPETPGVVRTESGMVRGREADKTLAFKGIPYAAPPIGERRWRATDPAPCWNGVREASGFGYVCMQPSQSGKPDSTPTGSEDCLTVNVWTPEARRGADLPVMVFVHGGYFTWGSSSARVAGVDLYDGEDLATRSGSVVVTFNYRVGALGWIGHRSLGSENDRGASGNYGLHDQIAALAWVQRNIEGFGGDRTRVMLFGQSAGAISVAAIYASPLARGLFTAAVMHSGNGAAHPLAKSEAAGLTLERALGCDGIDCMRSRSGSEVVAALPESFDGGFAFGPTVDGWALPDMPIELVRAGRASQVPLIAGVTADEFTTMINNYAPGAIDSDEAYRSFLVARFGAERGAVIASMYPSSAYPTPKGALIDFYGDVSFVCPTRRFVRAAAEHAPARRFVYAHTYDSGPLAAMRAGHGFDLPFVLRNFFLFEPSERELALADQVAAAWGRFAAAGEPGAVGGVEWPEVGADDSYLVLDVEPSVATRFHGAKCDEWDRLIP